MDTTAPSQARKAKRVEVSLPTTLIRGVGQLVEVELRDLSFYGFKAKARPAFSPGEYVKIHLPPFGLVRARVTWAGEEFFGGSFATALDVRKCLAMAASTSGNGIRAGSRPLICADPA